MGSRGKQHGQHAVRKIGQHAPAVPRVEQAIREDDVGRTLQPFAAERHSCPLGPRRDAPRGLAPLVARVPRRAVAPRVKGTVWAKVHIAVGAAGEGLHHLGAPLVAPIAAARGGAVADPAAQVALCAASRPPARLLALSERRWEGPAQG
eukprot:scaffold8247_cov116-Isochrysis_galbana.AAC.10